MTVGTFCERSPPAPCVFRTPAVLVLGVCITMDYRGYAYYM